MIDRSWKSIFAAVFVAGTIWACGDGTITFGGDDDDDDDVATVTITGNLDDLSPVTTRDVVVFVYNVDDDTDRGVCVGGTNDAQSCGSDVDCPNGLCDSGRCPCPAFPASTSKGKAVVVESGETEFTLDGLDNGAIKVVFLLDNAGDDADGEIDPGDPIAILDDEDCEIDDLDGNLTVTLEDVDIKFSANPVSDCQAGTPPAAGRARADQITQERKTTN